MRRSPLRHNLARLRQRSVLDLYQYELAEIAGCAPDTIQSVELLRLPLSEELARRISAATGVHFRWLIENDLEAPIIDTRGHPYSLSLFKLYQAQEKVGSFNLAQAQKKVGSSEFVQFMIDDYAASFYGQIRAVLSSAVKRDLGEVAVWKMAKFLEDCRSEFGHDKKLIGEPEQFGLRPDDSPYLKHRQVEAGIALFRAYDKEREREIRKSLAAPKPRGKPSKRPVTRQRRGNG